MEIITPVQIIRTQRSGSNLLRLMLNQIEGVFAPHAPHILSVFYPLLSAYGDLQNNGNYQALIADVCSLIQLNPVPWHNLNAERKALFEMGKSRTLAEIFKNIYELNARTHNANFWICNSMQNVKFLNHFKEIGLRPKIIYLYRDGRDVALSFKKAIVGPKHIYSLANKWREEQELSIRCVEDHVSFDSLSLSYESLILHPAKQLKTICNFLGLHYDKKALNFYTSEESRITAEAGEMWVNLTHPIIKKNINKYKKSLNKEEIHIFELIAKDALEKLGYELCDYKLSDKKDFSLEEIASFDRINLQLMQLA